MSEKESAVDGCILRHGVAWLALFLLIGCAEGPPPRLYLLAPIQPDRAVASATARDLPIGLTAVAVPEYLDRPEIMRRVGGTEIVPIDSSRWAERLSVNVGQVVAENLGVLLGSSDVVPLPVRAGPTVRYEVALDLSRFEQDSDAMVVLVARWAVSKPGSESPLASGRTSVREPVEGPGMDGVVAAMSRNLAKLSRDIATAVDRVAR